MALTASFRRALVEGGPKTVASRAFRKLLWPVARVGGLVFAECDLSKPFPETPAAPGIVFKQATLDDIGLFENQTEFLERFSQGHRCFMGIEEKTGKLTNYRWVNFSTPQHIPEIERYLILGPREAYIYDLKTLPEFRRLGIDAFTRHHTYAHFRDAGYTRLLAYIHADNRPNLNASRKLLQPIGRIWYVHLRGCDPILLGGSKPGLPELRKI